MGGLGWVSHGRQTRDSSLDALLDELADLAHQQLPPGDFYQAILKAVLETSSATAAALWSVEGERYRLESQAGLSELGIETRSPLQALHEEALAAVCVSDAHWAGHSLSSSSVAAKVIERTQEPLVYRFFACRDRGRACMVLETVHGATASADSQFHGRLLAAIAEIVNDFYTLQRLQRLEMSSLVNDELLACIGRIYGRASLTETALEIVNEGRRYLNCQRMILVGVRHQRARVLAISGLDRVEDRSRHVRGLCDLAQSVAATRQPLHYPQPGAELPQQAQLLQRYLDTIHSHQLSLYPLTRPTEPEQSTGPDGDAWRAAPECQAVLIVEEVTPVEPDPLRARKIESYWPHAGAALAAAIELEELPLAHLGRWLKGWRSSRRSPLWRGALVALTMFLVAVGAFLIPSELTIQAKGHYEPEGMRHVYAPQSGEVIEVKVDQDQSVTVGDRLVVLRSRQLDLKREELITQRSVTIEKLRGIESARSGARRSASGEVPADLSASERELREVLASQDQQLKIVQGMLESLEVASPIDGRVVSWNPRESLELRPVSQGQRLMSIARDRGPGRLHLRIEDGDVRHVAAAMAASKAPLQLTFSIASNPGRRFAAQLLQLGTISETINGDGPTVRMEAAVLPAVTEDAVGQVRPGATVIARVHCGQSNLGYVWTRRLWDLLLLHWIAWD